MQKQTTGILTYNDFQEIRKTVKEEVEERTSNLPTKDEFATAMDKMMKELAAIRQESVVHKLVHEDIDRKFANLGVN